MRVIVGTAVGIVTGMVVAWLAFEYGWVTAPRGLLTIDPVPRISLVEVESHRATHFDQIRTIEDTLALPGDFAQTEALYALAGRSDSAGVQALVFQADAILDPADRRAALSILFSRLAELDPASALALARSRYFGGRQFVESTVWQTWGKLDLDGALEAAGGLQSRRERDLAAQALFSAYGYWGNDTTGRIARHLGIQPDRSTRSRYLYMLAAEDPAAAIGYLHSLPPSEQAGAASTLGTYLGESDPDVARLAAELPVGVVRRSFEAAIMAARAQSAPEEVLDELLGTGASSHDFHTLHSAVASLAHRDLDLALGYLEKVRNPQARQAVMGAVAEQFARQDPYRALAWAKEGDHGLRSGAYLQVLSTIAQTTPDIAVEEALGNTRRDLRMQALSTVSTQLAGVDPQRAIALLTRLRNPADRDLVGSTIATMWTSSDPDAALAWILDSAPELRGNMLQQAGAILAQSDPDTAIRLLPRVDEDVAGNWRSQIVAGLATSRPAADVEAFIARFEGTDEHSRLLSAAIDNLAYSEPDAALRLVDGLADAEARSSAVAQLIPQVAMHGDPQRATAMLASISDDAHRAQAAGMVAGIWTQTDPAAAENWVSTLPRGDLRDQAIARIASQWEDMTSGRQVLLDSIGSVELRREAQLARVYRMAQSDPQQAERMLYDMPLTDEEREHIALQLRSFRDHDVQFGTIRSPGY